MDRMPEPRLGIELTEVLGDWENHFREEVGRLEPTVRGLFEQMQHIHPSISTSLVENVMWALKTEEGCWAVLRRVRALMESCAKDLNCGGTAPLYIDGHLITEVYEFLKDEQPAIAAMTLYGRRFYWTCKNREQLFSALADKGIVPALEMSIPMMVWEDRVEGTGYNEVGDFITFKEWVPVEGKQLALTQGRRTDTPVYNGKVWCPRQPMCIQPLLLTENEGIELMQLLDLIEWGRQEGLVDPGFKVVDDSGGNCALSRTFAFPHHAPADPVMEDMESSLSGERWRRKCDLVKRLSHNLPPAYLPEDSPDREEPPNWEGIPLWYEPQGEYAKVAYATEQRRPVFIRDEIKMMWLYPHPKYKRFYKRMQMYSGTWPLHVYGPHPTKNQETGKWTWDRTVTRWWKQVFSMPEERGAVRGLIRYFVEAGHDTKVVLESKIDRDDVKWPRARYVRASYNRNAVGETPQRAYDRMNGSYWAVCPQCDEQGITEGRREVGIRKKIRLSPFDEKPIEADVCKLCGKRWLQMVAKYYIPMRYFTMLALDSVPDLAHAYLEVTVPHYKTVKWLVERSVDSRVEVLTAYVGEDEEYYRDEVWYPWHVAHPGRNPRLRMPWREEIRDSEGEISEVYDLVFAEATSTWL